MEITKSYTEKILNRIHGWIKSVDQKISILLAFQGVLVALLFPLVFKWVWKYLNVFKSWEIIAVIASLVFLFYGIAKSFSALMPRVYNGERHKSLIFFGDIAKETLSEYKNRLEKASEKDILNDLISQTYISSKIANNKHNDFRDSMLSFAIGVVILIVLYAEFIFRKIL